MGSQLYVSGFPLPSDAVPTRLMRFLKGDVIANATVFIPNGYQLLYSNPTLPGMSGGAVLNAQGQLIGIHGQGETDSKMSEQQGVAVKTGTNQAVPIDYYTKYLNGEPVAASALQASTSDDYLAQAKTLLDRNVSSSEVISLANLSLSIRQSERAYILRGVAKERIGKPTIALEDYSSAIRLNPNSRLAYNNRGSVRDDLEIMSAPWLIIHMPYLSACSRPTNNASSASTAPSAWCWRRGIGCLGVLGHTARLEPPQRSSKVGTLDKVVVTVISRSKQC